MKVIMKRIVRSLLRMVRAAGSAERRGDAQQRTIIKRAPASKFENPPPKPYCYWGDGLATDVL